MLTPYDVPADVVTAARAHLTSAEIIEVDVMRNAANKIAVALFRTDADGNLKVVASWSPGNPMDGPVPT